MKIYYYELIKKGCENSILIDIECNEKPIVFNSYKEHYMIVNGAKIIFDYEIREVKQK